MSKRARTRQPRSAETLSKSDDLLPPAPEKTPETDDPVSPAPRISVQLDPDTNRIAWQRIRSATREQLRVILADPDLEKELGISAPSINAAPGADDVPPEVAALIFEASSSLMMGIARRYGYTTEQARVLAFTGEEIGNLAPLTAKVINQYVPGSMGKHQNAIMLAVSLTAVISGKIAMLRKQAPVMNLVPDVNNETLGA